MDRGDIKRAYLLLRDGLLRENQKHDGMEDEDQEVWRTWCTLTRVNSSFRPEHFCAGDQVGIDTPFTITPLG